MVNMAIFSGIFSALWIIVKLILTLSVITIVHEFGHFICAKLLNIRVNEFSIGFGPKIVSFKKKETMYSFRAILLGGYNALAGESGESDDPRAFVNQPGWKKLIVLVMGSVFNIIFAIMILMIMGMSLNFPSTQIKSFFKSPVTSSSIVEDAGLLVGDKITKINGEKVTVYSEIADIVKRDKKLNITFERAGKEYEIAVEEPVKEIALIGIMLKDTEEGLNKIEMISPGKVAMAAGLKSGDQITSVNGNKVGTSHEVISEIYKLVDQEIVIEFNRKDEAKKVIIKKGEKSEYFDIGFIPEVLELSFTGKVKQSVKTMNTVLVNVIDTYKQLFTGKVKVNEFTGIVGIGEAVSISTGIWDLLNLVAVISLSIGLMNLLPIPPMDGGKIVIVLFEMITRKKISEKVETMISSGFFLLLILLTIYVTLNDIIRIF